MTCMPCAADEDNLVSPVCRHSCCAVVRPQAPVPVTPAWDAPEDGNETACADMTIPICGPQPRNSKAPLAPSQARGLPDPAEPTAEERALHNLTCSIQVVVSLLRRGQEAQHSSLEGGRAEDSAYVVGGLRFHV